MQLKSILSLSALVTCAFTARVTFDKGYENGTRSLTTIMCSTGVNGLMSKYNWKTLSDIPNFPYIGGASIIEAWNSTNCGKCISLIWNNREIHITAIDFVETGFNIGVTAFNALTGGQESLGIIDVSAAIVDPAKCGFTSGTSSGIQSLPSQGSGVVIPGGSILGSSTTTQRGVTKAPPSSPTGTLSGGVGH